MIFQPNEAQADFDKNKWLRNIILKSRQHGFTSFEAIDMLDDVLFNKNFSGLFIAHTKDDAEEIFDKKIDYAWGNLHEQIRALWKVDANTSKKLKFQFSDNSESSIVVANSGRSGTFARVHISELAKLCVTFPKRANEIISGTIPAVPPTSRLDIESTGEGRLGHFYELFWEAWERGEPKYPTEFKAHFYNWTWDKAEIKDSPIIPLIDMQESLKFKNYKIQHNLSDLEISYYYLKWLSLKRSWDILHQEYPTTPREAFLAAGNCIFSPTALDKYKTSKGELGEDGMIMWDKPSDYSVMGVDVAEGKTLEVGDNIGRIKRDLHCIEILDKKMNQIMEWTGQCTTKQLALKIALWAERYKCKMVGVEANGVGLSVLSHLREDTDLPLYKIYQREVIDQKYNQRTKKVGWHTNDAKTKPVMLEDFVGLTIDGEIGINSELLIKDCLAAVRDDNGRVNTNGLDRLMAMAVAIQMYKHKPPPTPLKSTNQDEIDKLNAEWRMKHKLKKLKKLRRHL